MNKNIMQYDIELVRKIQEKRDSLRNKIEVNTDDSDDIEIFSRILHRNLYGTGT